MSFLLLTSDSFDTFVFCSPRETHPHSKYLNPSENLDFITQRLSLSIRKQFLWSLK